MVPGYLRKPVWEQVRKRCQTHSSQQAILAKQLSDTKSRGLQSSPQHLYGEEEPGKER